MTLPASVVVKLDRADEQFDGLGSEIVRWAEGAKKGCRLVLEHNGDFTEHTLGVTFDDQPPVERWGQLVGEGFQSLRSALDHLVYAIAISESGEDPPPGYKALMFPICDSADAWKKSKWRINALSDKVRAQIEREQPDASNLGQSVLWRLDEVNRADKHRLVHVAALTAGHVTVPLAGLPASEYTLEARFGQPVENGAPFLIIRGETPAPDVRVDVNYAFDFPVCVQRISDHIDKPQVTILESLVEVTVPGVRAVIERVADAAGL